MFRILQHLSHRRCLALGVYVGRPNSIHIDALPYYKPSIINSLCKPRGYPKELITIGDHIKAKRLDKGLYQKELAKILKITTSTLINWELGRHNPPSYQFKIISDYLGYCPYNQPAATLPLKLKYIRCYLFGMKIISFAKQTGFDPSSKPPNNIEASSPILPLGSR